MGERYLNHIVHSSLVNYASVISAEKTYHKQFSVSYDRLTGCYATEPDHAEQLMGLHCMHKHARTYAHRSHARSINSLKLTATTRPTRMLSSTRTTT